MRKLFLFCSLFFIGCSQPKGKNLSLLLDGAPSPLYVPLYAGEYGGIFAKYGFTLQFITSNEDAMRALITKKTELAMVPMYNTIKAAEAMAHLRVIGAYVKSPMKGFVFREETGVVDRFDFHLKSVAAFPQGFLGDYLKSLMLHSSVTFVESDADIASSLLFNKADIISSACKDIEGEKLASMGIKTDFLPLSAFHVPDYQEEVLIVLDGTMKRNMVRKFQRALDEAIAFAEGNPDLAFEYYSAMNPDKDVSTLEWERLAWKKIVLQLAKDQDFQKGQWQDFQEWMVGKNLLTKRIDLDRLLEYNAWSPHR